MAKRNIFNRLKKVFSPKEDPVIEQEQKRVLPHHHLQEVQAEPVSNEIHVDTNRQVLPHHHIKSVVKKHIGKLTYPSSNLDLVTKEYVDGLITDEQLRAETAEGLKANKVEAITGTGLATVNTEGIVTSVRDITTTDLADEIITTSKIKLDSVTKEKLEPDVQASLDKADSALQSFTETDPTVPAWAKEADKPTYTKSDVGLGNIDNTSDANKPISTATQTALDAKITANTAITGATKAKITYDSKGLVTSGADLVEADIPTISIINKTTGILTVERGGTGLATLTSGALMKGNGTGNVTFVANPTNDIQVLGSNGTDGTYAFRVLAPADIPSLSTEKLSSGILPTARGGTGKTQTDSNLVFAGPSGSYQTAAPVFRALVAADIPILNPNQKFSEPLAVINGGTGASSVDTPNLVFASKETSPATGWMPTWRALVTADIPSLDTSKLTSGTLPIARGGYGPAPNTNGLVFASPVSQGGTPLWRPLEGTDIKPNCITADNMATNAITTDTIKDGAVTNLKIAGIIPINKGGTGIATSTSPNLIFATATSGSTATAPSFRALVAADIPSLDASKLTAGILPIARGGTGIATSTSPNLVFATLASGTGATAPSLRALVTADLADSIITTAKLAANAVTNAKLAKMAANTLKGNNTTSSTDPSDIAMNTFLKAPAGQSTTQLLVAPATQGNAPTLSDESLYIRKNRTNVLPTAAGTGALVIQRDTNISGSKGYNEGIRINRSSDGWACLVLGGKKDTYEDIDPIGISTPITQTTGNMSWYVGCHPDGGKLMIGQNSSAYGGLEFNRDGKINYISTTGTKYNIINEVIILQGTDLGILQSDQSSARTNPFWLSIAKSITLLIQGRLACLCGHVSLGANYYSPSDLDQCLVGTITIPNKYLPKSSAQSLLGITMVLTRNTNPQETIPAAGYFGCPANDTGSTTMTFKMGTSAGPTIFREVWINSSWFF